MNVRPEQLMIKVYQALFERNPKVKPEEVEAVFCGTANQAGMQNDIARLAWLGGGFPEVVATNGINRRYPSYEDRRHYKMPMGSAIWGYDWDPIQSGK